MDVSGLVYGIHIHGNLPAGFQLYIRSQVEHNVNRESSIDVRYRVIRRLPEVEEIWVGQPGPQATGRFALFRERGGFGLTVACEGSGVFRLRPKAIEIEWLPEGTGAAHYFFSHALPLWLESRGIPVLHASAVAFGDRAVAFVGQSGIGKSTLCAGLVRSGCHFVVDDGVPLRKDGNGDWRCAHGPPLLRLWPSALEDRLGVSSKELPRVHDSLEKRMMPCSNDNVANTAAGLRLASVYVLDRQPEDSSQVTISACTARESLVRLIEHSVAGAPVAVLGLSAQRLEQLSRVVSQIPVKTLRYPSGDDPCQLISEAILEDLARSTYQGS